MGQTPGPTALTGLCDVVLYHFKVRMFQKDDRISWTSQENRSFHARQPLHQWIYISESATWKTASWAIYGILNVQCLGQPFSKAHSLRMISLLLKGLEWNKPHESRLLQRLISRMNIVRTDRSTCYAVGLLQAEGPRPSIPWTAP